MNLYNFRNQLAVSQNENKEKMQRFVLEEKHIREENVRLQRKLQQEVCPDYFVNILIIYGKLVLKNKKLFY